MLYGVLKTYELELFRKKSIQAKQGVMVNNACALMCSNSREDESQFYRKAKVEEIMEKNSHADEDENYMKDNEEDEYYTIEEIEKLDNNL